jgi:aminopeptidase N
VLVEETPATFFRQADKLIINLPQAMAQAAPFGVAIAYSGQPPQEPSAYVPFAPHLGLHYLLNNSLFVVAEPDGARNWFPANDHPRDKATFRFELLVPAGLTGVANGLLVDVERDLTLPDGSPGDLYIWEVNDPMATYLATVAVAEYERVESVSPQGVLLRHYVFPEQRAAFETAVAPVGEMLDWLGERFGPYPFEAFGYVTTAQEGFTLETQTMVILSTGMMRENVIIHEMVHMWFGDWVSPASWGDIWRNEGFATYLSDMWETRDNPAALEERIAGYRQLLADSPSPYPLNRPPPEAMFGRDSYLKGAVVAHALRQEIGDDAFFEGLRTYFERYGGGTASHAEFQAVLEEAAGVSLDEFFATWLK